LRSLGPQTDPPFFLKLTYTPYPHFEAPSPSLKEFYNLVVERSQVPSQQHLVESPSISTNAIAGPSRTSYNPSSSAVFSTHHQLPPAPKQASTANLPRIPSPPPPAFSPPLDDESTSRAADRRRDALPHPEGRTNDPSPRFHETKRGRSPPPAPESTRTREDNEDAIMADADAEQPSAGPPQELRRKLGPTGARVVPRGRRRSAVSLFLVLARLFSRTRTHFIPRLLFLSFTVPELRPTSSTPPPSTSSPKEPSNGSRLVPSGPQQGSRDADVEGNSGQDPRGRS